MDLHLKDKIVVITGGGTGIGRGLAEAYLKEDARVAVCGRRIEPLAKFAGEMKPLGYEVYYESVDVTDRKALAAFAARIEEKFGTIDIWINNAGIAISKRFLDFTDEDFDTMTDTNLKSVFMGTQIAAEIMKRHGGGVIVNAASFNVMMPHVDGAIYAATKAGVSNFTKSTAAALAPFGIRVFSYVPGMIATEMSRHLFEEHGADFVRDMAVGHFGTPADMAPTVVFLSSDQASYITGIDMVIAGGKFAVQDCSLAYRMEEEAAKQEP